MSILALQRSVYIQRVTVVFVARSTDSKTDSKWRTSSLLLLQPHTDSRNRSISSECRKGLRKHLLAKLQSLTRLLHSQHVLLKSRSKSAFFRRIKLNLLHRQSIVPRTTESLKYDLGLLAVYDPSPLDTSAYSTSREDFLRSNAREGVQGLVNALWERPTTVTDDGVMASLPAIETVLPREKPLPKPSKDLIKWQEFAKRKGIAPKPKRDRLVYDEEKKDWVPRYGYKGKNKENEDEWLVEVPADKDSNFNPRQAAKQERQARTAKNTMQREKNISRAKASDSKKTKSSGGRKSKF